MLCFFQKLDKEIAILHMEVKQNLYDLVQVLFLSSLVFDQNKWGALRTALTADQTSHSKENTSLKPTA